jgi:hypothetical protein
LGENVRTPFTNPRKRHILHLPRRRGPARGAAKGKFEVTASKKGVDGNEKPDIIGGSLRRKAFGP